MGVSFQAVNADMSSAIWSFWTFCLVVITFFGVGQIVNGFIDGERKQVGFGLLAFTVAGTLAIVAGYQV